MPPIQPIQSLVESIIRHRRLYTAGTPEISDLDYDQLETQLYALAPHHPLLQAVGTAPTQEEGKIFHRMPMLSLAKTYALEDLRTWAEGRPVVGTWKIDGVSLSLLYEKGRLLQAKTRGDGQWGENATEKAIWIPECLSVLPAGDTWEIRGELYCTESSFSHLLLEMERLGLEVPTSPRNIVAGILGRKQHVSLARFFSFFAFDAIKGADTRPFATETEKYQWLQHQGFSTPFHETLSTDIEMPAFIEKVRMQAAEGEIPIDGVVFTLDEAALQETLGATSHHPRYKLAFKWQGEVAVSTIVEILWATSRLGVVTPVARIEPVTLSGAQISNVTLHNAAHVQAFHLKAGDRIEIIRSGEVIPKFLRVVTSQSGETSLPTACPSCQQSLVFDDIRLCCTHLDCPAQAMGRILNWIRCVDIEDLSEKRLQALMDRGLVRSISDLYRLTLADFLSLPLTKEKMASKLLAHVQKTRRLSYAQFLTGLGIGGMGAVSWEKIGAVYPTVEALQEATAEGLAAIKGFAEKTAQQIVSGLQDRREEIAQLQALGMEIESPIPSVAKEGPLSGQSFVLTGTLSRPRKEIETAIQQAGGRVVSAVSGSLTALIVEDPTSKSTKANAARTLHIPMWTEVDLWKKLGKEITG